MNKDKYKQGEEVSQRLFEVTGDPRFRNIRRGFEELRVKEQNQREDNQNNRGREMWVILASWLIVLMKLKADLKVS